MSKEFENKITYRTELYIVLATAIFPLLTGILLLYIGLFYIPNDQWYKPLHLLLVVVVFSYPILHYRDRYKSKSQTQILKHNETI